MHYESEETSSKKRKDIPTMDDQPPKKNRQGRRKINIEFIEDKSRRQITFSKRKAGIMKKAYELTTLTGTQALLLIASETGHVYTFATPKLQPFVTRQDGKALIQRCLNSPDAGAAIVSEENASFSPVNTRGDEEKPVVPPPVPYHSNPMPYLESSLILMVGKVIPISQSFTASQLKDLTSLTMKYAQQIQQHIICVAGGFPTNCLDYFRSPNDRITADIVVGLKCAEVDYTSPNQPSFSREKLLSFLTLGENLHELFREIASKNNISDSFSYTPNSIYVVSTYPEAFVNVVFGVRKQGANGKGSQVVGISCHTPETHVSKLEIDERSHQNRLQMTASAIEGVPYYHLLPEISRQ